MNLIHYGFLIVRKIKRRIQNVYHVENDSITTDDENLLLYITNC